MGKNHKGVGSYSGVSKTSTSTGGKFDVKSQFLLQLQGKWQTIDLPTFGLQTYLDASNSNSYSGSGTTWTDLSGNNRNYTFASSPSFTTGSIKYFGSTVRAVGPASNSFGINNSSGYTIFLTVNQNSLNQSGAFKFYSSNGSGSAGRGIFSHCTWSNGDIYIDQAGCCNTDQRTNVPMTSPQTGAWKVIGYRCNAVNERSIWQNGTNTITNSVTPAAINLSGTQADIFQSDEYSSGWDARVGQFVVYNRALSDAEMVTVTNTLKTKVGL